MRTRLTRRYIVEGYVNKFDKNIYFRRLCEQV